MGGTKKKNRKIARGPRKLSIALPNLPPQNAFFVTKLPNVSLAGIFPFENGETQKGHKSLVYESENA